MQNSSLAKMKFLAVSSVIVTFYLLPVVDCASVSLSSSQMYLQGNIQVYYNEPREIVWNGLTNGKYFRFKKSLSSRGNFGVRNCDFSCQLFCSLVLEFGYCSTVSWLFFFCFL